MPRVLKMLLSLGLFIGVILLGAGWILSGAPMPAIAPARTAPPEGFKAALYPELSALVSTERADVLNLGSYGTYFEHYHMPDLGITYFILFTETNQERIVFVNKDGSLIGDITDQPQMLPMGPFIVTPDAYYVVTGDGVSKRQAMEDVTSLPVARLKNMIDQSTHYTSFDFTDVPDDNPSLAAGRRVHVMRHNGIWKRAVIANLEFEEPKIPPIPPLDEVYFIARAKASGAASNFFGSRYRVELTHFDQQEFLPERSAPFGSTTGVGRPARWVGTGYYTVFIDNAPALRFRIDDDTEIMSGPSNSQLNATGGAKLDFITLIHRDDKAKERAVVVRGR